MLLKYSDYPYSDDDRLDEFLSYTLALYLTYLAVKTVARFCWGYSK